MRPGLRMKMTIASMAGVIGAVLCLTAVPASASTGSTMLDATGYCLGIASGGAAQQNCSSAADQQWYATQVVSGHPSIFKIENDDGNCLYAPLNASGSETAGERLTSGTCNNSKDDFRWFKADCSDGYCKYASAFTLKGKKHYVIGIKDASVKPGAAVILWTSTSASNQRWLWTSS
jgi:uncharacterized membrane protein